MSKLSRALWPWRRKRKERLQLRLWDLKSTSNSPVTPCQLSCQISANQHKVEMSTNVNKHWITHDIITNVISANQHFALTFSMQIFKFQRRSCKLSFLFLPCRHSDPESLLPGYTVTTSPDALLLSYRRPLVANATELPSVASKHGHETKRHVLIGCQTWRVLPPNIWSLTAVKANCHAKGLCFWSARSAHNSFF